MLGDEENARGRLVEDVLAKFAYASADCAAVTDMASAIGEVAETPLPTSLEHRARRHLGS